MFDVEVATFCREIQQAINVRVLARVLAGILGVLGIQLDATGSRLCVDQSKELGEVVVDRQRADLAGLVLDGGNNIALGIEQLNGFQVGDTRQLFEVVSERHLGVIKTEGALILLQMSPVSALFQLELELVPELLVPVLWVLPEVPVLRIDSSSEFTSVVLEDARVLSRLVELPDESELPEKSELPEEYRGLFSMRARLTVRIIPLAS